jgi:hypothetical protein
MAARKKKSIKKTVKKAKVAKKTARKAAKTVTKAKKKTTAKAAKRPVARKAKTVKKAAKKTAKASRGEYGEGNYKASKNFRTKEEAFIKANRSNIPKLAKAAETALDGPEGDELRAAETETANRGKDQPEA